MACHQLAIRFRAGAIVPGQNGSLHGTYGTGNDGVRQVPGATLPDALAAVSGDVSSGVSDEPATSDVMVPRHRVILRGETKDTEQLSCWLAARQRPEGNPLTGLLVNPTERLFSQDDVGTYMNPALIDNLDRPAGGCGPCRGSPCTPCPVLTVVTSLGLTPPRATPPATKAPWRLRPHGPSHAARARPGVAPAVRR
jgi:hypothetical protein